jgi:hypothetical protein
MNQLPTITELSLKYIPYPANKDIQCEYKSGCYGMSMKWAIVTPEGKTTMHGIAHRYPVDQSIADSTIEMIKQHAEIYEKQCKLYASTGYVTSKQVRELHDSAVNTL